MVNNQTEGRSSGDNFFDELLFSTSLTALVTIMIHPFDVKIGCQKKIHAPCSA